MKYTNKYKFGYFEEDDFTLSSVEIQRWESLDAQLYSLFSVLGNGIISGWNLLPSSGLSIAVTVGSGHVNFVSAKSTENAIISGLIPSSRNYIHAGLTSDSYWTQSVVFSARADIDTTGETLYLGYADTSATEVTTINTDDKKNLGFLALIQSLVKAHRHIGGEDNPPPVNLSSEVDGILNQRSIPDLDASVIQTGTIDQDRLPLIDHITKLTNQGTLTHAQLDSFVEALSIENASLMGVTSTVNLLQLILALKHVYPDIDEFLVNEIAYVPGISPDSYVDWDNTTATVDTRPYSEGGQHTITGEATAGKNSYTYTWNSNNEFLAGTYQDVTITGNSVALGTKSSSLPIDQFNDLSKWDVITTDLSASGITLQADTSSYVLPPNSGKLVIQSTTVEIALTITKEFDAQDWSSYNKIVFFLKTDSVQHGDIYFEITDAYAGTQGSATKVLERNRPTINVETLQNGWQEVVVDLTPYTRTNINTISFYISSQDGWDTAVGFNMNLDNIYLTTGIIYKDSGYIRLTFGSDFLYEFWRMRWDADVPGYAGVQFKVRTRVSNTLAGLAQSVWSSYVTVSGTDISLPTSSLYKYIEIESYFEPSTDLSKSPVLRALYLDYYASDVENSVTYDSKNSWDAGTKINIDTNTSDGSILIYGADEVDNIIYGTQGEVNQLNSNLVEIYNITGSMIPRSTYQILNDLPPSLGLITGVDRGNDGNIWLCDTDNDRVLEVDKSGELVKGFFGSFLVENNTSSSNVTSEVTTTTTTALFEEVNILQSLYNNETGVLYTIFDKDVLDADVIFQYLRVGSNSFYVDSLTKSYAMDLFTHVFYVTLDSANKTLLNYMVNQEAPTIVISTPYEQKMIDNSSVTVKFLVYNFELGSGSGDNGIRITLDSLTISDNYSTTKVFTGLANGRHTVKAQLLNADGSLNTNREAIAEGSFIVYSDYDFPYISIINPKPNQIYTSSPVVIDFNVENYPILATGQHLRYVVDSNAPIDYYSEDSISISDLSSGNHIVRLYLVDKDGSDISGVYPYATATIEFNIGLNSSALVKLYGTVKTSPFSVNVDVANMIFTDVYAPFDIQYIPCEVSATNPSGQESVLIGKLSNDFIVSKLGV